MERCGEEIQVTKTQNKHKIQTSLKFPKMMKKNIMVDAFSKNVSHDLEENPENRLRRNTILKH